MIEPILTLLLGILVILAIIAANGYFVAQEFAYMAVDRTRLAALAASGDESAKRALDVTKRTSFMLSGAQLGITVTGLMVGYVAEPLVGESMGVLLQATGMSLATGITVGTVLALVVATLVQMIFGELYPKNLAIANSEPLSLGLARSTLIYMSVFGWLISFFDKSANRLLRMLRIEPVHDLDVSASADDLPHIIANSRDSGDLPLELSLMMDRVLDFPQRDIEHAMVPRSQVEWVDPETTLEELRGLMARAYTRYPVIDEYGGFAGVLTIEDLAMEIVGEITDEHDGELSEAVVPESDDTWVMEGDVHLDEVERAIGHRLPRGNVETMAGMLIAELGALPAQGDTINVELPVEAAELASENPMRRRLVVDVLRIERHVPTEVRVRLVAVPVTEKNG